LDLSLKLQTILRQFRIFAISFCGLSSDGRGTEFFASPVEGGAAATPKNSGQSGRSALPSKEVSGSEVRRVVFINFD
jgi:hypothetical protein